MWSKGLQSDTRPVDEAGEGTMRCLCRCSRTIESASLEDRGYAMLIIAKLSMQSEFDSEAICPAEQY
jgi:hypothetical protein